MITLNSIVNLFVLGLAAYGFYTTVVRRRRRVLVEPRPARKSEMTQSWIDEKADEKIVPQQSDVHVEPEPPRTATGRSLNVSAKGRLFRLEEFAIGDQFVTMVTKIDRRGDVRGSLGEKPGRLEDIAKQFA